MVNNQGIVIHKLRYKTGRKHDYIFTYIKRIIQQLHKTLLMYLPLNAFLDIETDFPDHRSSISIRRETCRSYPKNKKHTPKVISKSEYW